MVRGGLAALVAVLGTLTLVSAAGAAGSGMTIGAVEDAAKWGDPGAKMELARNAAFGAVRMTMQWSSGQTAPVDGDLQNIRNAADAARLAGIEPIVAIYNDGSDAAAPAYEALLAVSYDAIRAARPDAVVLGGALSPRGEDSPTSTRPTHSPTAFIQDLGAAYRASGRTAPIMDVFDQHVYEDYSAMPPSFSHPNSKTIAVADYGKLVSLLGEAFDGTGQRGSSLPIFYGEYGVESIIPAAKSSLYTGIEPTATKAVDEATQASLYVEAFKVAYCKPNVVGIMVFHVSDESALSAWQSGPYYADDTAKSSLAGIRDAAAAARAGTLTTCPDTTPPSVTLTAPADGATVHGTVTFTATAADDVGVGKIEYLANGVVVAGKAVSPYSFDWSSGASGPVTITARALDAAGNAATSSVTVTVDNTPPDTMLTSTPPGVSPESATFQFAASEADATFECSLDGGAYAACASPKSYGGLAPGAHTFAVRAIDAVGNADATPASYSWTVVDTTPPETTITDGPSGTVTSTGGSFSFTATEPGTFACSLDGAAYAGCSSPQAFSGLAVGTHTFAVEATDAAGNADPTPATGTWTISLAPPNDMFAGAEAVTGSGGTVTGTNLNATKEPGEPNHAGVPGGRSIWYRWRAPATRSVTFDTVGSNFDTVLAAYRGSTVSALTRVAANDDIGSEVYQSRIKFTAYAGTTYMVAVDGHNAASGSVQLTWR